jgi:hypothetical protein
MKIPSLRNKIEWEGIMVFENINLELANQFAKTRWEFDKFQFNYFCDADLHMYSIVYIVDKIGWFNNGSKTSLEVSGYVFYQGKMLRNHRCLFTRPFKLGDDTAELLDINLGMHGEYNSKGIGTNCIRTLEMVLRSYGVKNLKACLARIDFDRKEQLYRFYLEKNGFELIQDLTPDQEGWVQKSLDGECRIQAYTK